jgi:hypothetical protein
MSNFIDDVTNVEFQVKVDCHDSISLTFMSDNGGNFMSSHNVDTYFFITFDVVKVHDKHGRIVQMRNT